MSKKLTASVNSSWSGDYVWQLMGWVGLVIARGLVAAYLSLIQRRQFAASGKRALNCTAIGDRRKLIAIDAKWKLLPLHDTFLNTSKSWIFHAFPLDRYVSISTSARCQWKGDKLLSRCVLFTAEMRGDLSRRQSRQNKPSCTIVMTLRHFQGVS